MPNIVKTIPVANDNDGPDAAELFNSRMAEAVREVAAAFRRDGLADALADALKADPRGAELSLRDHVFALARDILCGACEGIDDHGPSITVEGRRHHRAARTPGRVMTLFGGIRFRRCRYRPSGRGRSVNPTEAVLGIDGTGMTPAAREMSLLLMSAMTPRECEGVWHRLVGEAPSVSGFNRLAAEAGREWAAHEAGDLEAMRERETVPEQARSVQVCLDGVMMRMRAETDGDGLRPAGWREASTGIVQLVGEDGAVLSSRCFGRLPEPGKQGLKQRLSAEVMHLLRRRPDLKLVAIADAAPDNWAWLESLGPDRCLVDFWHSAQHLKVCADDAYGPDSDAGKAWFRKYREVLRDDPRGIGRTIEAIRYLIHSGRGGEDLRRELAFFRKNRGRMDYRAARDAGCSIGSGCVESSNKYLVQQRMKRSGQHWGREGGQAVLSFRSLVRSDRFDAACRRMLDRRRANAPVPHPAQMRKLDLAA